MALDGKPESHSSFVLSFRLFTHVSLLRFYRKWGLTLGLVSRCLVRERFVPVWWYQAICMGIGRVFGANFLYI